MIWTSCKIMDLASCLLAGRPYNEINHSDDYSAERLQGESYKRLAYVRKQNLTAYAHLVRATRNLEGADE